MIRTTVETWAGLEGKIGWRRRSELNRRIKVLQTSALPLGYAAAYREIANAALPNGVRRPALPATN